MRMGTRNGHRFSEPAATTAISTSPTTSCSNSAHCLIPRIRRRWPRSAGARELLENAFWMEPANKLTSAAIGQYQPGSAGGANSSTGFASGNLINPWDFVLMMEGSLLFSPGLRDG